MSRDEPWQWSAATAAAAVRDREVTPTELCESVLERINAVEPDLAAFAQLDLDRAREQAAELTREAAAGSLRGPLHGVPIAIKDIFDVEGLPTRCGSPLYADAAPARADAAVVAHLRSAGALLVGKTTTHELACGVYTEQTHNPWDLTRCCGGSSGGSGAAVAAGMAMAATGSDTGGSIRIPAAVCGVVGVKPTYDLLSRQGVTALSWSLDHVGPLARSVDDAALVLDAMLGSGHLSPVPERDLSSVVIGVADDEPLSWVTTPVREAFEDACALLADAGARVVHLSIPELEHTLPLEFTIVMAEGASYHDRSIRERSSLISEGIRVLFQSGAVLPAEDYLLAQRLRTGYRRAVGRAFAEHELDALIAPTIPLAAYAPTDETIVINGREESIIEANVRTTAPFNLTGLPVVCVPSGLSDEGRPVSVQFAGRPHDERQLLALARAYEQRRGLEPFESSLPIGRRSLTGARA